MADRHRAFFLRPSLPAHRLYEALRAVVVDGEPVRTVAPRFHYTPGSLAVYCSRFRAGGLAPFFQARRPGPKSQPKKAPARERALALRKQNHSVYDIQRVLRHEGQPLSVRAIWEILREAGFARLPRRADEERPQYPRAEAAAVADRRAFTLAAGTQFTTPAAGLFLFVPLLVTLEVPALVRQAGLPGTRPIPPLHYLLALLALKLLGKERISHVMDLCHDPGAALFAGLNALPKTTALTTSSYRLTRAGTLRWLRALVQAARGHRLLPGRSFNVDFHAVPHFGEASVLEKHYVPRRSHAEKSVLVFLAQDGTSRALCYSNARVLKAQQPTEILRFVAFWERTTGRVPQELVFDSRLTTVAVLAQLDARGIRFLTLRRRNEKLIADLLALPRAAWTPCHLDVPHRKYRDPLLYETRVRLKDYPGELRQLAIKGLGRELPTLLLTNALTADPAPLLTRYAQRMVVENAIADGVHFFHLDALCSGLQLEVDFSVALTVAANLCYRLFARRIAGFEAAQPKQIYRRFVNTLGHVRIERDAITVRYPKRAHNPLLLEAGFGREAVRVPWLHDRVLRFEFG
jgi:transposase